MVDDGDSRDAGLSDLERALESHILNLLNTREQGKTICVSEAARAASDDWRALMEPARQAAKRLVDAGEVVVTQSGRIVDISTAKGPIRIRRAD
ncbi:MAG: hypothetical protein JWP10_394 [Nocardioidaceae bacterium]|nr:hypothetical protein [Nocardioidaceae bacterium]